MKRIYAKFRIMLMTFALGLAAVYLQQGLSFEWWGVPVDLPEARSASVLEINVPLEEKPPSYLCDEFTDANERAACLRQFIFESRDLSLYDDGGVQGCGVELVETHSACTRSLENARRFVWEHWKKRKRGYVAIAMSSAEHGKWTTHLFIEPDGNGSWRVDARWVPMRRDAEKLEHYLLGDLVEIKWNRATAEDERYGVTRGSAYLTLTNITGDSLIL
jgi:hypothetical protein